MDTNSLKGKAARSQQIKFDIETGLAGKHEGAREYNGYYIDPSDFRAFANEAEVDQFVSWRDRNAGAVDHDRY